jgi:hypothetical protein
VSRVHGLQHIQRFAAATLTHHDTIGTLAQRILHQFTDGHSASSVHVRGLRFHAQHMVLLKL